MANITKCPVCGSDQQKSVVTLIDVSLHCNILSLSKNESLNAPKGTIELVMCLQCSHYYNAAFEAKLVEYSDGYEATLFHSKSYQKFARETVEYLINRYDIKGKSALEIGCGDGQYLSLISSMGENRCLGLDPGRSFPEANVNDSVKLRTDYFKSDTLTEPFDLFVCRHVLEHLECPSHLLSEVSASLDKNPSAVLYFEVPNALFTIKEMGIWDLIYEHFSYFTPYSLKRIFSQHSLAALKLSVTYHGQFLSVESRKTDNESKDSYWSSVEKTDLVSATDAFKVRFHEVISHWQSAIKNWQQEQKKVVIWGTGSKGVTFLNLVDPDQYIVAAVDINPDKSGKFVAGTGHPVILPSALKDIQPDVVVIMNSIYVQEIATEVSNMNLQPTILTV